nr:hypothetical protein [Chthoniobacterales bacterium]
IEQYATEHSTYPVDVGRGVIPAEMVNYFGKASDWTGSTPIGGEWNWNFNVFGVAAAIGVVDPTASDEQMQEIDSECDDGNLTTGRFRKRTAGRYVYIVEE